MSKLEEESIRKGITVEQMMENAGKQVAEFIAKKFRDLRGKKVTVFCGLGNNGGDGIVAARYLKELGAEVTAILLGRENEIKTKEAKKNWDMFDGMKLYATESFDFDSLNKPEIIIDAIFGTGVKGKIRDPARKAIEFINRSKAYKVSVDIPSGLDPLTGEVEDISVKADATVTMHKPKTGLRNTEFTGELYVASIGIQE